MRSKLINMTKLYVEPGENSPENGSKATVFYANKKQVEFNQDVHMKYIPNIIGLQTKNVKDTPPPWIA